MGMINCNIYQYNSSIERELQPDKVDDLSRVSCPHPKNEEIHQDLLQDVIKINWVHNIENNFEEKEKNYTTDLIRGENIEISVENQVCLAHIDNGTGMTILTLRTFKELKWKFNKLLTYLKFGKPFSFQSFSDHEIKCIGYIKILTKIAGCEFDILFHVIDGTNLGIVIGRDFMTKSVWELILLGILFQLHPSYFLIPFILSRYQLNHQ